MMKLALQDCPYEKLSERPLETLRTVSCVSAKSYVNS